MRTTGLLPIEQEAMEASVKQFKAARENVIQELTEFFESVVADIPQLTPVWRKYPQGDRSFCDNIAERALHVQSLVTGDRLETNATMQDAIKTLLVQTVTWSAWRRVVEEQSPVDPHPGDTSELAGGTGTIRDSFPMLTQKEIAAEEAAFTESAVEEPSETPPRQPDTTEPAPTEDSPRTIRKLFGKR